LARRIRARSNWFTFHIPRGRIYCAVAIRANRPPDRLQLSCILGLTWISFPTDLIDDARLLVTHVSNRNGAFAANRAAVNDADECSSVSAAQNFYFASLRGLATQQWSYDAVVVDGAAPPFVEATKRIGVLEDPDCLRIVFVAQHLRVAGGCGRDRYRAGYETAPKHKQVLVLRPAGRYQFQDGVLDCFFWI
jgi:hypothetical protein